MSGTRSEGPDLLIYDDRFLAHETGDHPESPERLRTVWRAISQSPLRDRWQVEGAQGIAEERLCQVHTRDYLDQLDHFARRGGGRIEDDTVVSRVSPRVARLAAGSAAWAVRAVLNGSARNAFVLLRPPGHHALSDSAMGFCLLNNVAVAAKEALTVDPSVQRVLVVDWDVHHGNGTQAMFWRDAQVGFFSIHRWPFYPGTGAGDEIGEGPGRGYTCNVPIAYGTPRADYLAQFTDRFTEFAGHVRPDIVLVSAGFDAHRLDPIGDLGLEAEDFAAMTHVLRTVCRQLGTRAIVSLLEGGYNTAVLPACVLAHLQALGGE